MPKVLWGVAFAILAEAGAHAAEAPPPPATLGRTLFVDRCAKCHDADASRKLPGGRSLVERLATKPDLRAALQGRIKDLGEEQQKAIVSYVGSLVEKLPGSGDRTR
jgi:mono/diheme cytochrome c family protein